MEKPKFCLFKMFEGNRYLRLFKSLEIVWLTGHALESVVVVSAQQGPHLWSPACLLPLERAAKLSVVGRCHFYIWSRGQGGKHFAQEFCSNLLPEDLAGPHLRILTVSPFSEGSGSPALPWAATLTPSAPDCVAHLHNGGAEVPIQPHAETASGWQDHACNMQCAPCISACVSTMKTILLAWKCWLKWLQMLIFFSPLSLSMTLQPALVLFSSPPTLQLLISTSSSQFPDSHQLLPSVPASLSISNLLSLLLLTMFLPGVYLPLHLSSHPFAP